MKARTVETETGPKTSLKHYHGEEVVLETKEYLTAEPRIFRSPRTGALSEWIGHSTAQMAVNVFFPAQKMGYAQNQ